MDDFIVSGQHSSSAVENREHEVGLSARRIVEIPSNQQMRVTYGSNGEPEYIGFGAKGLSESSDGWLLYYMQYDGSNRVISRKISYNSWDNRATATYE